TGKITRHEELTGPGHLQLGLRRHAPFVTADLLANPFIECVVAATLGRDAWLGFYNGNVNCPGSADQPLHFDRPYSWKTPEDAARDGQPWPPHTTTLSCSIALEEITVANGATEIYPGSHLEPDVASWTAHNRLQEHPELLARRSPARMVIPAHSVCFRDPRMWHRGVSNPSGKPRAMIAATYHAAKCKHWRGIYVRDIDPTTQAALEDDPKLRIMDNGALGDGRLVFDADARPVFEAVASMHGINRNVRFVAPPKRVNHFLDAHEVGGARVIEQAEPAPF
ncbi:MAG: phytanoyl-CoA dioxygenase family protein, partial [Brevundimonas sp.]|nr:phytanoyl-CoA dioxygenase family protein [Brevundimonas sp.]